MELGFFTMPLHPPGSDYTKSLDDDLNQIVELDRLGYKEAWIGEHFTSEWENIPNPDLFIAQALPVTENIVLGTGVTCMPNHDPFMLAHRIAQLDHMAHGRFIWGVGAGAYVGDCVVWGYDPSTKENRRMIRDAIDLVLRIWEDPEPGLYEEWNWRFTIPEPMPDAGLRTHIKPYQKPHPPIAVGGVSPHSNTLAFAGEKGWIPMSINIVPTGVLKTHWEAVEKGAIGTGRTPDRSAWRICKDIYVAETTKQARKEVLEGTLSRDFEQYFIPLLTSRNLQGILKVDPDMPDSDIDAEYLMDNVWIVGSPDEVADQLRRLHHDVGGFGMLTAIGHEWEPRGKWLNSMTLLAEEVMPKLSDLD
jgi:alkanesulfonate monooxygenase SsuD/methylene tetrahydromethanopterin reductase-like flavin-dependent oxidoreductase (luciferase family)